LRAGAAFATAQKIAENAQYKVPEITIAAGKVSTQAKAILRTVESCTPAPFAAMVPTMPEDKTWVVETGSPYMSAAAIVAATVVSAQASSNEPSVLTKPLDVSV
jgi:hypothetical protein